MFSDKIARKAAAAAEAGGIPKLGTLAIVEVETGGSPTEADGRTPNFCSNGTFSGVNLAARQSAKVAQADLIDSSDPSRVPAPILEATCWSLGRRKFVDLVKQGEALIIPSSALSG